MEGKLRKCFREGYVMNSFLLCKWVKLDEVLECMFVMIRDLEIS